MGVETERGNDVDEEDEEEDEEKGKNDDGRGKVRGLRERG